MVSQPVNITSIEQLQKHVPSIVKAVNADPSLAMGAAVHPLFAIEELGYKIPANLYRSIEHRIRFSPEQTRRLDQLAADIHRMLDRQFDIELERDLSEALQEELQLPRPLPANLTMAPQMKWTERCDDPLETYRDRHPAIKLILEYRKIEASEPRFGSRELYDQVRQGAIALPAKAITFQLQRGNTPS
jgi:hypothetical protein